MKAGEVLTHENLRSVRPGFGLSAAHFETVLGMQVRRDDGSLLERTFDVARKARRKWADGKGK